MNYSKSNWNFAHSLRAVSTLFLYILVLVSSGTLMAGELSVGECRESNGTQFVCGSYGWTQSSGESSCPAGTPNDTCAGNMIPGILGEAPNGPGGDQYGPSEGVAIPMPLIPEPQAEEFCESIGGELKKVEDSVTGRTVYLCVLGG